MLGTRFKLSRLQPFPKAQLSMVSNCMVHSSENITLLKSSFNICCSLHHTNLLTLFSSLISRQSCSLVDTHHSCLRWRFIVERETLSVVYPSINMLRSCLAVASSFSSNSLFITMDISCVIFFSRFLRCRSIYWLIC